MPSGKKHEEIGMAAGGVAALLASDRGAPVWHRLAEGVGGVAGGLVGGRLPDIIEPAVHPWHRDFAHSVTAGAGVIAAAAKAAAAWQMACRARADEFAGRQRAAATGGERALYVIAELFWRMAAGIALGAAAGYVSHLVLDGGTPRGIPVLTRGF